MENIKWGKLFDCALLGIFLSMSIVGFILVVVGCVQLIGLSLKLYALIIAFILLVIGLTSWAYKYDVI